MRSRIWWISAVTVDLPFEPVTATTRGTDSSFAQSAPPKPYTSLLVTARGATPDQSLLYRIDLGTGAVRTLFNEKLGALTDVTMDRHNSDFAVVHQGPKGTEMLNLTRGQHDNGDCSGPRPMPARLTWHPGKAEKLPTSERRPQ